MGEVKKVKCTQDCFMFIKIHALVLISTQLDTFPSLPCISHESVLANQM